MHARSLLLDKCLHIEPDNCTSSRVPAALSPAGYTTSWENICFGVSHCHYFTCRVKRFWSLKSYLFFIIISPNLFWFNLGLWIPTSLKWKIKNKTTHKFVHIFDYRKILKNCAALSPEEQLSVNHTQPHITLPSIKLKHQRAGSYPVYPQLRGRNLLLFLINQSFSCCKTQVTHRVQSSPPLENQVHCSHPAGSSITLKIKQFPFGEFKGLKKTQPHRVCKS